MRYHCIHDLGDLLVQIGIARVLAETAPESTVVYDHLPNPHFTGISETVLQRLTRRATEGIWINTRENSTHPFAQNTGRRSLARGVQEARAHLCAQSADQSLAELRETLSHAQILSVDAQPIPYLLMPKKYSEGGAWNLGSLYPGVIESACGPGRPKSAWAAALIWEAMDWLEEATALYSAGHPLYVVPVPLCRLDMQRVGVFWRSAYQVERVPHAWLRYERLHRVSKYCLEFYRLDMEYPQDIALTRCETSSAVLGGV